MIAETSNVYDGGPKAVRPGARRTTKWLPGGRNLLSLHNNDTQLRMIRRLLSRPEHVIGSRAQNQPLPLVNVDRGMQRALVSIPLELLGYPLPSHEIERGGKAPQNG